LCADFFLRVFVRRLTPNLFLCSRFWRIVPSCLVCLVFLGSLPGLSFFSHLVLEATYFILDVLAFTDRLSHIYLLLKPFSSLLCQNLVFSMHYFLWRRRFQIDAQGTFLPHASHDLHAAGDRQVNPIDLELHLISHHSILSPHPPPSFFLFLPSHHMAFSGSVRGMTLLPSFLTFLSLRICTLISSPILSFCSPITFADVFFSFPNCFGIFQSLVFQRVRPPCTSDENPAPCFRFCFLGDLPSVRHSLLRRAAMNPFSPSSFSLTPFPLSPPVLLLMLAC